MLELKELEVAAATNGNGVVVGVWVASGVIVTAFMTEDVVRGFRLVREKRAGSRVSRSVCQFLSWLPNLVKSCASFRQIFISPSNSRCGGYPLSRKSVQSLRQSDMKPLYLELRL